MFEKYKNIAKYALVIVAVPLAIALIIFIGNMIYYATGFSINIPDIYNKELVAFAGSYLGGVTILAALYFIIKYYKDETQHQTYIAQLDKEKESIFSAISKITPLTASNIYNQYSTLPVETNDYNRVKVLESKRDINSLREQLMQARTELQLKSDILDEYDKCINCAKKCVIIKYTEKFKTMYYEAERIIYDFLLTLEQYIDINSENNERQALIAQLRKQLEAPRLTIAVKEDLTQQIERHEAATRDAEILIGDLKADMILISQVHTEIKTKLAHVAKGYYFAKMREEYRSYLHIKSNDVKCKQISH